MSRPDPIFDPLAPPPHAARLRGGPIPKGTRSEYVERYMQACQTVSVALTILTPTQAEYILANFNGHNRRLSAAWRKIVAAVRRAGWEINGEAIIFDAAGRLINGQHRLKAIVEAAEPVPVVVFYGIRPEAFATFDQGKKRGAADVLSIGDHEHCVTLASALGWQQKYDAGEMETTTDRAVPNDLVLQLAEAHPDLCESAAYANRLRSKLVPPALVAFLHYQFGMRDPGLRDTFFDRVIQGVGVERDSHEYLLRRRLDGMIGLRGMSDQIEIAALVIKTWSRVRTGQEPPKGDSRSILVWKAKTEPFPKIM